ncbi:hypothetical protein GCM10008983_07750 [Lentibacillus halophilus]|uniref:Lipoprotein n=1 Tax=Lentibacillus halophilus TaxID=295065 RepID=A0ABN0Z532_9BACI
MKQHMRGMIILLVCSFIFVSCSNEKETGSSAENQTEKTDNQGSEVTEEKAEDISFGEKKDLGEKENVDSIFAFLDQLKLPNMTLDSEEDFNYLFSKSFISTKDEPMYLLHLTYNDGASNDLLAETHLYISNNTKRIDYGDVYDKETETLSSGTEVTIGKYDTEFITTLFEEDGIYYRFEVVSEDREAVKEYLIGIMEEMEKKNDLYEKMHTELENTVNEYFIMPNYFANNLNLESMNMADEAISFRYEEDFITDNDEEVDSQLIYFTSNESDPAFENFHDEDISEDIELPSGRKAKKIVEEDRENSIYLEENDVHIKFTGRRIERPLDNEGADELIKIIDSMEVD